MTKLSDTQSLILSAAAQREDRIALPLPESLRGGAAAKVVGAMLAKGLLQEVDADLRKGEPMWRKTGDGHGVTLVATDAGLAAIGIEPENVSTAEQNQVIGRRKSRPLGGAFGERREGVARPEFPECGVGVLMGWCRRLFGPCFARGDSCRHSSRGC